MPARALVPSPFLFLQSHLIALCRRQLSNLEHQADLSSSKLKQGIRKMQELMRNSKGSSSPSLFFSFCLSFPNSWLSLSPTFFSFFVLSFYPLDFQFVPFFFLILSLSFSPCVLFSHRSRKTLLYLYSNCCAHCVGGVLVLMRELFFIFRLPFFFSPLLSFLPVICFVCFPLSLFVFPVDFSLHEQGMTSGIVPLFILFSPLMALLVAASCRIPT